MTNVNSSFTFSSRLISSNFPSIPFVFHQFFTWIALGDVDLHLSLILATRANIAEGGTVRKEQPLLMDAKLL